ncbi:phage protein NinX family protein [Burkholderia multivorans]|uniref:phage protein NinX family protein n=1 Tax=Burkholderia multivorans TaxID=87883 RepID=UPI0020B44203|nr:phage protein NinX family protein [Burkholderia multivorans]
MTTMKVNKLSGKRLDYWVAKAEGHVLPAEWDNYSGGGILIWAAESSLRHFAPSTDWAHGGPIIARARIDLAAPPNMDAPDEHIDWAASFNDKRVAYTVQYFGETPLVAAMRAYVASTFGDEVPG